MILPLLISFIVLYFVYRFQRWFFRFYLAADELSAAAERSALRWGAFGAVTFSVLFSLPLGMLLSSLDPKTAADVEGVFFAPLYEEFFKGLAPLYAALRLERPGPRKLFVAGALSGVGFFAVETAIGFLGAAFDGSDALAHQLSMRALALAFMHPLATALVGLGLGLAAAARSRLVKAFWALLGFGCGSFSHMLNNAVGTAVNRGERIDQAEFLVIHTGLLLLLLAGARVLLFFRSRA